jgi:hypothetical protein
MEVSGELRYFGLAVVPFHHEPASEQEREGQAFF